MLQIHFRYCQKYIHHWYVNKLSTKIKIFTLKTNGKLYLICKENGSKVFK